MKINIQTTKFLTSLIAVLALVSCSGIKKNFAENQEIKPTETSKQTENNSIKEETLFSISDEELAKARAYVVYFDTNSSTLKEDAISVLNKNILPEAKEATAKKIVIEAHCDERGSLAYNQKLSTRRANAVKNYLTSNGVKTKIKAIGYGETKPVATGHDEESWAKNRRAVSVVIEK